jgi:hypothetical protein
LNRREFLTGLAAASIAGVKKGKAEENASPVFSSLIPSKPCKAPNYWCTWSAQNYVYGQGMGSVDIGLLEGDSGSRLAHDAMGEAVLLGPNGWASSFHSRVREDLYLLLDDGWEKGGTATFELDSAKFPSFKGSSAKRLEALNRELRRIGWRGAALWCRNPPDGDSGAALESMCVEARIEYWKIDGGDRDFSLVKYRDDRRLPLTLEHVNGEPPTNGDWKQDGRFGSQPWDSRRMEILRHTDVYRTYDVTSILSLPTTLDRLSEMLKSAAGHPELRGLINVEDEAYVAAVMGCTMGVMRHPLHGLRGASDPDLFFNGSRHTKMRMDEIVRALHWQRIAPPFASGVGTFQCSQEILKDGWTFSAGETWSHTLLGATVWQSAPAVLARDVEIPIVESEGEKPFVFACRFPGGAVAIGAQERTHPRRDWYMPAARVTLNAADAPGPFGIFGEFERLTLRFGSMRPGLRVIAQDLAGDEPVDITGDVDFDGTSIQFNGRMLRRIGLSSRTPGDLSSPGLVVAIT